MVRLFTLVGAALYLKDPVLSLGVLMDRALLLNKQVADVAQSVFYQLQLVCQLWRFLKKKDLTTVVHAQVMSRLNYCKALHTGLPLEMACKLQLV